jgi:hypothetical protein
MLEEKIIKTRYHQIFREKNRLVRKMALKIGKRKNLPYGKEAERMEFCSVFP